MENRNILVIEDNELNMKLMRGVFRLGGYQIIEAYDAESGIHLAREHQPFLILMDIQLPGMDGLKATQIIKTDPELRDIPVVALTGFAMQCDEEKALNAGCDGYITKPIDVEEVIEIIESFRSGGIPNKKQHKVI